MLQQTGQIADRMIDVVFGGVGGLVAVGLAFAFGSRLVKRVRDLETRTRLIADGDFRSRGIEIAEDVRELG